MQRYQPGIVITTGTIITNNMQYTGDQLSNMSVEIEEIPSTDNDAFVKEII